MPCFTARSEVWLLVLPGFVGLKRCLPLVFGQFELLAGLFVEDLLGPEWIGSGLTAFVQAVGIQFARLGGVEEVRLEDVDQPVTALGVFDWDQEFDPAVEVARHPVGTGDEDPLVPPMLEVHHTGMF